MTAAQTYAWIFLSVPAVPAQLHEVIGMADGINKAIPTDQELRDSFGWLLKQGLIRKDEGRYALTQSGKQLRDSRSGKSVMKSWDVFAAQFEKTGVGAPVADDLSSEEVARAYDEYQRVFRELVQKREKRRA